MIIGLIAGGFPTMFIPTEYWSNCNWSIAITVFAGFLTFNGILLALGWSAFSKFYEILISTGLGNFLTRNDLLESHLFFIEFAQIILILSACWSGFALVSVLIPFPLIVDQGIMAIAVGLTIWALLNACSVITLINDLVWESAQDIDGN